MIPHLFNFNLNPFGTKPSCSERISKFSVFQIWERIGKMSSTKIIFPLGLVTMATTLSKTYTTKLRYCCSIQKTVPQQSRVFTTLAYCVVFFLHLLFIILAL